MPPFKILQSEAKLLDFDFAKAVEDHINALTGHTKSGGPAPVAHPYVERAVFRAQSPGKPDMFVPHYIIEDDTPPAPPAPTLAEKKDAWDVKLRGMAQDYLNGIMPPRKQMLVSLHAQAAMNVPEAARTPEQKVALAAHMHMMSAGQSVNLWLAQQLHSLEDATDATIDTWQPAPLPGA